MPLAPGGVESRVASTRDAPLRTEGPVMHRWLRCLLLLALATPAAAQPTLDQLWPNENGTSWTYQGLFAEIDGLPADPADLVLVEEAFVGRLIFDGTATFAPGVEVQRLVGQISQPLAASKAVPVTSSPLLRALWRARPELREAIAARAAKRQLGMWPGLLLGPSTVDDGTGHRQTADRIGAWRDAIADWSWMHLTDELFAGAEFTLQLVPDLASDVFLHGTVRGNAETVDTAAGSWTDAVIIDYVVDMGTGTITDEGGNTLGTTTWETSGWVAYVPSVGPVASFEETEVLSVDCPSGCDEEVLDGQVVNRTELELITLPVGVENESWSGLKSRW